MSGGRGESSRGDGRDAAGPDAPAAGAPASGAPGPDTPAPDASGPDASAPGTSGPDASAPDASASPPVSEPSTPELREPDLPRTAKVRQKALRTGWTTGACASAAAKAAAQALATGRPVEVVEIGLPSGRRVTFATERCELLSSDRAEAVVVKDAGDDPDVTHGAHITATVTRGPGSGLHLDGGVGVGVVTRPGLGLDPGEAAINPVPRQMIGEAVREAADAEGQALTVVISVPEGERMARKTTNAKLGIIGGISILGTTGIVRPFSTASWRASVEQAVSVMAAQGEDTLVLCTGGRTEKGAMALLPHLPEVCFVEVGDFTGAALRRAVEYGLSKVVFVGMAGKLTKLAAGVLMTHYTRSKVSTELLGDITRQVGGGEELAARVDKANTGRHAYELWEEAGLLRTAGDVLCRRVADVLTRFTEGAVEAEVAMVDFTGKRVMAAWPQDLGER